MNQPITIWDTIKNLINTKAVGEVILRREVLPKWATPSNTTTEDQYRSMLTKVGFLSKHSAGKYKVEKHIPPEYNFNTLVKQYATCQKKNMARVVPLSPRVG